MTGYLVDNTGNEYVLPTLFSWAVQRTDGRSSDGFEVKFLYRKNMKEILDNAVKFYGMYQGKTVFYGIVDEYSVDISAGSVVTVSGRGMAGALMDNEAEAAEFYICGFNDILERCVYPFGVKRVKNSVYMPPLSGFNITTGESCWSVLKRFTEKSGGVTPYFDSDGTMILSSKNNSNLKISKKTGVFDLAYKYCRYGEISKVVVRTVDGRRVEVANSDFIAIGGNALRVTTATKDTPRADMVYTGQELIKKSKMNKKLLTLSLPALFAAQPRDVVSVSLDDMQISGNFIVCEATTWADGSGSGTKLTMSLEE